jgi:DNA-binding PadR family transcriptional regulator
LQREGWIESEWGITGNNQRAKFYRLTREGKKQLAREETKWKLFVKTMARVMRPQEYAMGRWLSRKQDDSDLSEELRAHLAIETRQRTEAGESPDEAARAARRVFGSVAKIDEDVRESGCSRPSLPAAI